MTNKKVEDASPDLVPDGYGTLWVEDHRGDYYLTVLKHLHDCLNPPTYLEIGIFQGSSLGLSRCASIAIDPNPQLTSVVPLEGKSLCALYRGTSDEFFTSHDPKQILGQPIALAFLDGMHLSEFLLRDFINVERHCRKNSIIVLHDCLPVEWPMAERDTVPPPVRAIHGLSWTGDVWRVALLLKQWRPDLEIRAYDAPPTGIVCVTNLDPTSSVLADDYDRCVKQMTLWSLRDIGIASLFEKLGVRSTEELKDCGSIFSRFEANSDR